MNSNPSNAYGVTLKAWPVKLLGPKPSDDQLAIAHVFGRPGKQSLALAMAMRECGMTAGQMQIACGAPQNNHRRGLINEGLFSRDLNAGTNEAGHTIYKVSLTAKGAKAVEKANVTQAAQAAVGEVKPAKATKPRVAKAKATGKPRKAKVPPAAPVDRQPAQGDDGGPVDGAAAAANAPVEGDTAVTE